MRVYCGCQMLSVIWWFGNMHQLKRHNGMSWKRPSLRASAFSFWASVPMESGVSTSAAGAPNIFRSELRSAFRCESVPPERSPPPPAAPQPRG